MHTQLEMLNGNSAGETDLHRAVQANDETAVRNILESSPTEQGQLNGVEPVNGWTPLSIACVKGLTPIAKILLAAGAKQDAVDFSGWTGKEHAVFRGHLNLAKHFAPQAEAPSARLKPQDSHLVDYRRNNNSSQIFVYLGPSHTRSSLAPVEVDIPSLASSQEAGDFTNLGVMIRSHGTTNEPTYNVQLPLLENMVNKPLLFLTEDPEKAILTFEVYRRLPGWDKDTQVLGTATALLKGLRQGLAPKRESITRHCTVPLIRNKTMTCIGSVTFSVLIVAPFHAQNPLPKASLGFWQTSESYPIVGHRGSGANSTARTVLQIGENTFQSFLTAIDRGASSVEFDVQLTKDYRTVIYHDFLVKEIGGDVSLHELTFDQFQHLSRSQAPESDILSLAEQKYIERTNVISNSRPTQRRNSLNEYDHGRGQDLLRRIKYTDEGLRGNFKGNLRGCAIQEPSTTLEELLTSLPDHIAFDIEIKYPMLWEAEDRAMEFATIELNTYADTILNTVFCFCGERDITLSSFSPEICIALACKQRSFPILMINKAGTVPVSDIRAGSLKGAIEFATAWNLDGVVVKSDPFVMCPRLLTYTKDMGLVVASYGDLNNEPECALVNLIFLRHLSVLLFFSSLVRAYSVESARSRDQDFTNIQCPCPRSKLKLDSTPSSPIKPT